MNSPTQPDQITCEICDEIGEACDFAFTGSVNICWYCSEAAAEDAVQEA